MGMTDGVERSKQCVGWSGYKYVERLGFASSCECQLFLRGSCCLFVGLMRDRHVRSADLSVTLQTRGCSRAVAAWRNDLVILSGLIVFDPITQGKESLCLNELGGC